MSRLDRGLLLAVFAFLGIGLVQVYSSSFMFAIESRGDGLFFFKRQLAYTLLGIVVLFMAARVPFRWIENFGWLLWPLAGAAVIATFVPGYGVKAGGAARWLMVPGVGVFEPSEVLKIALSLLLATYFSRRWEILGSYGWLFRAVLLITPLVFVLRQPDFGSFAICATVILGILFAFGLRWVYLAGAAAVAVPAFYFLVMQVPYRRARIMTFLDPWSDPEQKGFQVIQSMLSFQSGGLTGVGLGQGQGKLFFLPEAHTDFTLAVLGEEMGFIGIVAVLALYGFLVFRGLQLATRTERMFAKVLALGLSLTFAISVIINAGVAMGMLPTKGLTIPFLSSGGSSLLATCLLFGLLLNIERLDRESLPDAQRVARILRRTRRY